MLARSALRALTRFYLVLLAGSARADEVKSVAPCKDSLEHLEMYEPWESIVPGSAMPSSGRRLARFVLNNSAHFNYLARLAPIVRAGPIQWAQLSEHISARVDPNGPGFYFHAHSGLNYVQPIDRYDFELLERSSLDVKPIETFRFKFNFSRHDSVYSATEVSRNRGYITRKQIETHWHTFFNQIGKVDRRGPGGEVAIELIHSHPLHAVQVYLELNGSLTPLPKDLALLELSVEDREFARVWSIKYAPIVFKVTAVLPNAFKYTAVYKAGEDITASFGGFR